MLYSETGKINWKPTLLGISPILTFGVSKNKTNYQVLHPQERLQVSEDQIFGSLRIVFKFGDSGFLNVPPLSEWVSSTRL